MGFADDIGLLARSESELALLVNKLNKNFASYGMKSVKVKLK